MAVENVNVVIDMKLFSHKGTEISQDCNTKDNEFGQKYTIKFARENEIRTKIELIWLKLRGPEWQRAAARNT